MPKSFLKKTPFAGLLFIGASIAHSELLLDAKFDDPQGTLAIFSEGITVEDTARRNYQGKNVATTVNAKALPLLAWPTNFNEPRWQQLRILREDGLGIFLRASQRFPLAKTPASAGVDIIPQNPEVSIAALARIEKGMATFDGGLDMIFRLESDPAADVAQWKLLEVSSPKSVAFRIASFGKKGLWFTLLRNGPALFDNDLDGTAESNAATNAEGAENSRLLEFSKIYHLALTFSTDTQGVVTIRLFLREGPGPIDTSKPEYLHSEIRFRMLIPEGELETVLPFSKIPIGTTPLQVIPGTLLALDISRFRLFKPAPQVFPTDL